jgi:hypothetical protein
MLQPHVIRVADECGYTGLEVLITDPLFQIVPDRFPIGQAAKYGLAKSKARYDNKRGGYPTSVHCHEGYQPEKHCDQGNDKSR